MFLRNIKRCLTMVYRIMYKRTHTFMCLTAFFIRSLFQQQYYLLYV